jgi:hypothetical protein
MIFSFTACQKELTTENNTAVGTMIRDANNNCVSSVSGSYIKNIALSVSNYVDAQINISQLGSYSITTDTINGYYFKASGEATATGLNTVRLFANGTPLNVGTNNFTITFNGSFCNFSNTVNLGNSGGGSNAAVFTFSNNGTSCSAATQTQNFFTQTATNSNNSITIFANVTVAGTYNLTSNTINGISFTGNGNLTVGSNQAIILTASGTPTNAGIFSYNFTNATPQSSCGFDLTVLPSVSTVANFSFNCSSATYSGTYQVGTAMNANNTITMPITVTAGGTYAITGTANGVTFSKSGILPSTPSQQTITIFASGTPTATATPNTTFILSSNGTTCNVTIPFAAASGGTGDATFGYVCANSRILGTFQGGIPLTANDVIKIPVYVGTSGNYNITSNTINGITFSASGYIVSSFSEQFITLTATGQTPSNSIDQEYNFSITGTGSFQCSVRIPFTTSTAPLNFYKVKIDADNYFTNFNTNLQVLSVVVPGINVTSISGDFSTHYQPKVSISFNTANPILPGIYNQSNSSIPFSFNFKDFNGANYVASSGSSIGSNFIVEITSVTSSPNRIKGKFSGNTTKTSQDIGPPTRSFSFGEFSIPY